MFKVLKIIFTIILLCMIAVTVWASLDKDVMRGFAEVWAMPWGAATLADAYFGFLTFYCWVFYKEGTPGRRLAWFIAIMILGNIGMSVYMLIQLWKLNENSRPEDLLLRRPANA